MKSFLEGKRVLVTGACGTVGREIAQLLISGVYGELGELVAIDNNESELFFAENRYGGARVHFLLRDLRDFDGLNEVCTGVDIIFHTAALKHVGICEMSPSEAVHTNIIGLQNLIKAAKRCRVRHFIFTSSDKAVNPTNVMGTSKLMGERLVTAANNSRENRGTIFASTRFGNVLGSRGSVVPIFRSQIMSGKRLTITDKDMTRFIMTALEAAELVIESALEAKGGEVFITKMPVARIEDLAGVMIKVLCNSSGRSAKDVEVVEIGAKPGEKLYEELMSEEETGRAIETERYFVVLPAFRNMYPKEYIYENSIEGAIIHPYKSSGEIMLSPVELEEYLVQNNII